MREVQVKKMKRMLLAGALVVAFSVILGTAGVVEAANLLRNPGFETIPGTVYGQAILPSDWIQLMGMGADTYSNDGSYGLNPGDFGNFPGVTAHGGIRWVAGWNGGPESFAQELTAALTPGTAYDLSAFLITAKRGDISASGSYEISLTSDLNQPNWVVLGTLSPLSGAGWSGSTLTFVAPHDAGALSYIVLKPVSGDANSSYPGIDDLSLTARSAPVPEPVTMLLLGPGLLALGGLRRKFNK